MGKYIERVFQNNSLKPNAASHNASWYTDTDGLLNTHLVGNACIARGPALQKIIPFWGDIYRVWHK